MLGLTFWKHAIEQTAAEALTGRSGGRRRRVWKILLLVVVAIAALAFVIGMPLVGLSAYLLKTLPFIVFAS